MPEDIWPASHAMPFLAASPKPNKPVNNSLAGVNCHSCKKKKDHLCCIAEQTDGEQQQTPLPLSRHNEVHAEDQHPLGTVQRRYEPCGVSSIPQDGYEDRIR